MLTRPVICIAVCLQLYRSMGLPFASQDCLRIAFWKCPEDTLRKLITWKFSKPPPSGCLCKWWAPRQSSPEALRGLSPPRRAECRVFSFSLLLLTWQVFYSGRSLHTLHSSPLHCCANPHTRAHGKDLRLARSCLEWKFSEKSSHP